MKHKKVHHSFSANQQFNWFLLFFKLNKPQMLENIICWVSFNIETHCSWVTYKTEVIIEEKKLGNPFVPEQCCHIFVHLHLEKHNTCSDHRTQSIYEPHRSHVRSRAGKRALWCTQECPLDRRSKLVLNTWICIAKEEIHIVSTVSLHFLSWVMQQTYSLQTEKHTPLESRKLLTLHTHS